MRKILLLTMLSWLAGVLPSSAIITIQAWYKLGEDGVGANKEPQDSSGNARHFINAEVNSATGVTILTTTPPPGSSQYYDFSGDQTGFNDIGWDPPEDNIGVECWARANDLSFITGVTVGSVVFGTGSNTQGLGILYQDFGNGFIGVLGNVDYVGLPYIPASTSEWVHLAVVRDGGVTTFYVNGVAQSPVRTSGINDSTIVRMAAGGPTNFSGKIDDARIFTFNPGEFYLKDLWFFQGTNTSPYVTLFKGTPQGFTIRLQDKTTTVNPGTIQVQLNSTDVTASSVISGSGGLTTIAYTSPAPLASGSSQTVKLVFADNIGTYQTNNLSFTVATYIAVPAEFARTAGSVDTTKPGFRLRPYVTDVVEGGAQPNSLAWTEDQMIGLHGANYADLSSADSAGFYDVTGVVNFSIEGGTGVDRGNFINDAQFPGIPGLTPNFGVQTGDSSAEVVTFLQFPTAGLYTMGVNSDDGFKVTVGKNPRDRFSLTLGQFDGGRGASDTIFTVLISQAGIYPFRVLWENGDGELPGNQANLEWFTVLANGTKVLVNDLSNPSALRAYRAGALPAFVSRVKPAINETGTLLDAIIEVDITDDGTMPNASSIKMAIDAGALAAPTSVTKVGTVTTAKLVPASQFPVSSQHTAKIAWNDTGSYSVTNTWQFTTLDAYVPPGLWTAIGSGDSTKRGFRVKTFQAGYGIQSELPIADQMAHQLAWGTNVADLSTASGGEFPVSGTVNWEITATDIGFFQTPLTDSLVPGIPGTTASTENYAVEALAYVEFPTSGIYTMGVNSDDGFRVTAAHTTGPDFGAVRIPSRGTNYPSWPTYSANGGLFGGPLPRPHPFTRPLVKANDGTTPNDIYTLDGGDANASYTFMRARPVNAAELAGNIGVVRRGGGITFAQKARFLQDAGAVAMVVVDRPDVPSELPFGMGGSDSGVTIPCVMINWGEYASFWESLSTNASQTLIGSIGEDCSPVLAQFDGGRGQGTPTIFSFYVPQAGLYPMRLLYFQAQGGGNCEWFSVDALGNKILLNDTTTANSLKTYRARTVANRGKLNTPVVAGNQVTISWTPTGELEEASSVLGPWTKSPDQANPQKRDVATGPKYFRLHVY